MKVGKVEKMFPGETLYPEAKDFTPKGDVRHPDDKLPGERPCREVTTGESVGWAKRLMPGLFRK